MVALVKNGSRKNMQRAKVAKLQSSMICPICKNAISSPNVLATRSLTRYGLRTRHFFDWCFICDHGVEEIVFLRSGAWITYKWRLFVFDVKGKPIVKGWVTEVEVPVPIVIVGPGGDYDKPYLTTNQYE